MDTADVPSTACKNKDVFDAAYPTAEQALAHLATLTTVDIARVGHSRGGLIGRKLLEQPAAKAPGPARSSGRRRSRRAHRSAALAWRI